jgi:hypothetical protein
VHLGVREDAHVAAAVDAARLDQRILGLAPIGAAVHAQRATDRARNAAQKRETRKSSFLGGARNPHIRHRGAGTNARAFNRDLAKATTESHHHTRHATIAHDQVRASPTTVTGISLGRCLSRSARSASSSGYEQHLRRSTNAKPGERRQRLVRQQPPAQRGHLGFEVERSGSHGSWATLPDVGWLSAANPSTASGAQVMGF